MVVPRWMIERKRKNSEHEILTVIEVYAASENKEIVKQENKNWTYKRTLIV